MRSFICVINCQNVYVFLSVLVSAFFYPACCNPTDFSLKTRSNLLVCALGQRDVGFWTFKQNFYFAVEVLLTVTKGRLISSNTIWNFLLLQSNVFYLTVYSVGKTVVSMIYRLMSMEHWWNDNDRGKPISWRNNCPSATLPTTDPTLTGLWGASNYSA